MIKESGTSDNLIRWSVDADGGITESNTAFQRYLKPYFHSGVRIYQTGTISEIGGKDLWKLLKQYFNETDTLILGTEEWWFKIFKNDENSSFTGVDVTNEINKLVRLEKEQREARNVFETLQDIYVQCDCSGTIVSVNNVVEQVAGYKPGELIGKNVTNYYLYSVTARRLFRQLLSNASIHDIEIGLVHKTGKVVPVSCHLFLREDNGRRYVEGVVRDIAQIKKTNKELKKAILLAEKSLKIKEQFLANMSHEIRTPLNGILGMINVLESSNLSKDQKDKLEAIKQSSDILFNLLNNLLDWSKLEAGKMEVRLTPVSLTKILNNLLMIYNHQAEDKLVTLDFQHDENIPDYILTDEVKLIQILSNLLVNAIKFTPSQGMVQIGVFVIDRNNGELKLLFEVSDTGPGISEEKQKLIFESFTQLNDRKSAQDGVGLGLSISKELIKLLNGSIGVNSKIGQGSTFWFTLPCEETEKSHDPVLKDVMTSAKAVQSRVLVVDDNRINLEVAAHIVENVGFEVIKADSGNAAMKLLLDNIFDLILLDIQMPEIDGVELLSWIKDNIANPPPVVALTAYNSVGERDKYMAYGFNDFVGKPINPEELSEIASKWVQNTDKVIDFQVLEKLKQYGGKNMVDDALKEFSAFTEKQIDECFVLLSTNNHTKILEHLHSIKGNAGTLGINRVAKSARDTENLLKKGYSIRLDEDLKSLLYFFNEFKALYFN